MTANKNVAEKPVVSIITVTWNHRDELDDYLEAVEKTRAELDFPIEVLIVDNDSADGTADYIESRKPWIRVLRSGYNAGFAEGCNIGFHFAHGKYFMLVNPDAIVTAEVVAGMEGYLARDARVRAVGCRLVHSDGLPQFSAYRQMGPLAYAMNQSMIYPIVEKTRKNLWKLGFFRSVKPREVGWLQGSCIMVKRVVWEWVGGFDPSYFMYCEDTDWCHRMQARGRGGVVYLPQFTMVHRQKGSVKRAPEWCFRRVYRSILHYSNLHMKPFERRVFHGVMLLDMLLRIPIYALLWCLRPSRRSQLSERIASVRRMIELIRAGNPDLYDDPPPGRASS